MARRVYSDNEKTLALACLKVYNNNAAQVSRELGIPMTTICRWRKGENVQDYHRQTEQEIEADLAQRMEATIHKLLASIPDKIEEASLYHVSLSVGILTDKMQVLRGEPDHITKSHHTSREERVEAILTFLAGNGTQPTLPDGDGGTTDEDHLIGPVDTPQEPG